VIGPGSANSEAKRWPQNYFSSVCDSLSSKTGLPIVLLGSQSEISVCAEVRLGCKKEVYDLSGKTSLEQTIAIASNAALVISNDMGLAHVAAASGAPTLTIFGPTDEKITRPIGQKAEIIRESVECSPCMLRQCPIDHRCMQRLMPERIFEAAMKMLK
jgi:heptosyltransferase-2